MTMDVALVFILAFGFAFFVVMRYKQNAILYNFFAIGCLIPLAVNYSSETAVIITVVGLIIWLLYDSFFKGV